MIRESLRRIPLFADLPDADLDWLSTRAEPMDVPAGSVLIREGEPGQAAYIVLEGEFEVTKRSAHQDIAIMVRQSGEVFGEMALLDQAPRSATVRAVRDGRVVSISGDTFQALLAHSPSASMAILQTVSRRLRQNEALLRQNEKMAALGTLAAGLAHELNNPAAAVRRSAGQLRSALAAWTSAMADLHAAALDEQQAAQVEDLRARVEAAAPQAAALDPLAQSDRETELLDWLEQRGIPDAWQAAPPLASAGWNAASLADLERQFPAPALSAVVKWLSASVEVYALLSETNLGAERISEIVKAVKAYAYLDQAPVQVVDVREGLENTLVILRPKLAGIQVERDFAPDLPAIEAYGSELNQVWTNILDNAAYAMQGRGHIRLKAYAEDGRVVVEIQDDGPGIPAEIQQRIFEPFFTTKPPGSGTGLGLHIVYSIIDNHNGAIHVSSRPGDTCFQVSLPVRLPAR
jgi:signal transduction histidine kinase